MFFGKKSSQTRSIDQGAAVILFPDKIIIETTNKEGEGAWYTTDSIALLPINISHTELGAVTLKHLGDSMYHEITFEERKKIRQSYRKKTKITEKASIENGRYVSIKRDNNYISILPFKSKLSDKMRFANPSALLKCSPDCDEEILGKKIREAWNSCGFI